jgi:hypothetical protein
VPTGTATRTKTKTPNRLLEPVAGGPALSTGAAPQATPSMADSLLAGALWPLVTLGLVHYRAIAAVATMMSDRESRQRAPIPLGPTHHRSALTRRIVSSMTPVARSASSRGSLVNFFSQSALFNPYDV